MSSVCGETFGVLWGELAGAGALGQSAAGASGNAEEAIVAGTD